MNEATPPHSAPPIQAANRIAITVQPTDLTLSLAQTRIAFNHAGHQIGTAVEYIASFSLSATTAKQLHEILGLTLEKYAEEFGQIPRDKAAMKHMEALRSKPITNAGQKSGSAAAARKRQPAAKKLRAK